jgi:hypothetical protein
MRYANLGVSIIRRRARACAPLCVTLFHSKFKTLCRARALRAARSIFPAHLLEIAAWSEGVKLCPSTSTATAGQVAVFTATAMPALSLGLVSCVLGSCATPPLSAREAPR